MPQLYDKKAFEEGIEAIREDDEGKTLSLADI